uniref:Chemokine interleukin-8-like domain-containing protein n=1 Tax=Paramormyrops kingsleyae TaxID=1676925 RepID=A0A3B3T3J4_9TELE
MCPSSYPALAGPVASCCLKTQDAKAPLGRLVIMLPFCLPRIKTVLGITICSDPSSPWAQRAMRYLDDSNRNNGQKQYIFSKTDY